ncbi:hypothetical protein [uncultured Jannaschia sp.]|uniref:hypothetical protein n=1 Tax=uncultured Jannaschia sp. TaxID=293347 RepID=UPI00260E256B|nr:hypothetical protein [uncultured Jannaschia sp.]
MRGRIAASVTVQYSSVAMDSAGVRRRRSISSKAQPRASTDEPAPPAVAGPVTRRMAQSTKRTSRPRITRMVPAKRNPSMTCWPAGSAFAALRTTTASVSS